MAGLFPEQVAATTQSGIARASAPSRIALNLAQTQNLLSIPERERQGRQFELGMELLKNDLGLQKEFLGNILDKGAEIALSNNLSFEEGIKRFQSGDFVTPKNWTAIPGTAIVWDKSKGLDGLYYNEKLADAKREAGIDVDENQATTIASEIAGVFVKNLESQVPAGSDRLAQLRALRESVMDKVTGKVSPSALQAHLSPEDNAQFRDAILYIDQMMRKGDSLAAAMNKAVEVGLLPGVGKVRTADELTALEPVRFGRGQAKPKVDEYGYRSEEGLEGAEPVTSMMLTDQQKHRLDMMTTGIKNPDIRKIMQRGIARNLPEERIQEAVRRYLTGAAFTKYPNHPNYRGPAVGPQHGRAPTNVGR